MFKSKIYETNDIFRLASGASGLSLTASCKPYMHKKGKGSDAETGQLTDNVPEYRQHIKPVFTGGKIKSASDTIFIALIGAGSWSTNIIIESAVLNKKIRVKYICDADDIRGGRAIPFSKQARVD